MFERFERPLKILCLGLAALLAWQLGGVILSGNPVANLKIPALPTLPEATNEPAKAAQKNTNGTSGPMGTNLVASTNAIHSTNATVNSNSLPQHPPAQMAAGGMSGGMPGGMPGGMSGGRRGRGGKKVEISPEVKSRVDKIIDSEIFGPVMRLPMVLLGIGGDEAFIQATNGQSGSIKIGGEMAGIKLLRLGVNRVLVEENGEKKELTLFDGLGGESLLTKPAKEPSTNAASITNRKEAVNNISTNQNLSPNKKENP